MNGTKHQTIDANAVLECLRDACGNRGLPLDLDLLLKHERSQAVTAARLYAHADLDLVARSAVAADRAALADQLADMPGTELLLCWIAANLASCDEQAARICGACPAHRGRLP
jgi:hypothetical protein